MDSTLPRLTRAQLQIEAAAFAKAHAHHNEPALLGLDYPVIEPYYLHRFKTELAKRYELPEPDQQEGITFPDIKVDVKFVNDRLNDSFRPCTSGTQMVHGLGYDVLLFVYHQQSDFEAGTVGLDIRDSIWVKDYRTANWYTTLAILDCLAKRPKMEDLLALFDVIPMPIAPGEAWKLAEDVLKAPPKQGYAAMGKAMQWHMRWSRVIEEAGKVEGILRLK
ncbi:MAG: hypothetical protein PHQ12_06405 [Chthoniobacteraceae bacterium]|nr:hypothetical protein [Chthoniobacteraceae bacterium]